MIYWSGEPRAQRACEGRARGSDACCFIKHVGPAQGSAGSHCCSHHMGCAVLSCCPLPHTHASLQGPKYGLVSMCAVRLCMHDGLPLPVSPPSGPCYACCTAWARAALPTTTMTTDWACVSCKGAPCRAPEWAPPLCMRSQPGTARRGATARSTEGVLCPRRGWIG